MQKHPSSQAPAADIQQRIDVFEAFNTGVETLRTQGASAARSMLDKAIAQMRSLPEWEQNPSMRTQALAVWAQTLVGDGAVLEGLRNAHAALQAAHEAGTPNAMAQDLIATLVYHLCGCYAPKKQPLPADWMQRTEPEAVAALAKAAIAASDALGAETALRGAISCKPQHAAFWSELTLLLLRTKATQEALHAAQTLTTLTPNEVQAWKLLTMVWEQAGQNEPYARALERVVALSPTAEHLSALAVAHFELGEYEQAHARAEQALAIDGQCVSALITLGGALNKQGLLNEAIAHWERARELSPQDANICQNLIIGHEMLGQTQTMQTLLQDSLQRFGSASQFISDNLFLLSYCPDLSAQAVSDAHKQWGQVMAAQFAPQALPLAWDGQRRLRVGFVSSDLGNHPVGIFLVGAMPHLAQHVELFAYCTRTQVGEINQQLRAAIAHWVDAQDMDDLTLTQRIRSDGIDILLDMNGHTHGNRLGVFARRAAPIQATWFGYFATTGLQTMDYVLCDDACVPPEHEAHFSEYTCRINPCYLSWAPPPEALGLTPNALPMLAPHASGPVFGCFNKLSKINYRVLAAWARILNAVPQARLLIKNSQLDNAQTRQSFLDQLAQAGIDSARVTLEGASGYAQYLASYHRVDLMLDTFPYAAGTTTVEALYMGVPVVHWAGDMLSGRIGTSILSGAGMQAWIAHDEDSYVRLAVQAVQNPTELARIRQGLRTQLMSSVLTDTRGFAQQLAQVFEAMARIKIDDQNAGQ